MTDIEQLLREALHDAPLVETRIADPVAAVGRRVGRVRAVLGSAVVVGLMVIAAAVVVPMQLSGSGASKIQIAHTPSPAASSAQPVVWDKSNAVEVTYGNGWLWELQRDPSSNSGASFVVKVDPVTHEAVDKWDVVAPADYIAYGDGAVWVWGGGDGGYPDGLVQAVDLNLPDHVVGFTLKHQGFSGLVPLAGTGWDAVVVAGSKVLQLRVAGGGLGVVATMPINGATQSDRAIAATGAGAVWVRSGQELLELDITRGSDGTAHLSSKPKDTVDFSEPLYGPAGQDSLWTFDGRLIQLSPGLLHQGVSVAEGDRIDVPGFPADVLADGQGGLFVSLDYQLNPGLSDQGRPGVYHLSRAMLDSGEAISSSTPWVADESPRQLAPDGRGGVDFVNADGSAVYWHPAS